LGTGKGHGEVRKGSGKKRSDYYLSMRKSFGKVGGYKHTLSLENRKEEGKNLCPVRQGGGAKYKDVNCGD